MTETPKAVDGLDPNPLVDDQIHKPEIEPDYKVKFSESSRENQRIMDENSKKDQILVEKEAEIERLRQLNVGTGANYGSDQGAIFPGFEDLGDEEKKNLINYTNGIRDQVRTELHKDPAIAFAKESYNERKFDDAFEIVSQEYPDLKESKTEFKSKYFNKSNVPENIKDIMKDLSKVYLFDKAKDLGAKEAIAQSERIEVERTNGGDKLPVQDRSLEDWHRLSVENPAKFAAESKKFNESLASGKLK